MTLKSTFYFSCQKTTMTVQNKDNVKFCCSRPTCKKTSIGFSNRWKQQEKHDSHVVFSLKSNCICFFVFFLHFDAFFKYDLDFRPEVSSREGHINGENWEDYMWSSYVTSTETMTISTPITRKNYYFSFFFTFHSTARDASSCKWKN